MEREQIVYYKKETTAIMIWLRIEFVNLFVVVADAAVVNPKNESVICRLFWFNWDDAHIVLLLGCIYGIFICMFHNTSFHIHSLVKLCVLCSFFTPHEIKTKNLSVHSTLIFVYQFFFHRSFNQFITIFLGLSQTIPKLKFIFIFSLFKIPHFIFCKFIWNLYIYIFISLYSSNQFHVFVFCMSRRKKKQQILKMNEKNMKISENQISIWNL